MLFNSVFLVLSTALVVQAAAITEFLADKHRLVRRDANATDFKVDTLPGLSNIPQDQVPEMHAGQLVLDLSIDKKYFFWKFAKPQRTENKLVFWYNGGPGCSSMDGALLESGPLTVNTKDEVVYRPGTWLESADMVFVDQPAGTGFSSSNEDDSELNNIADDMMVFFEKYFATFPEDAGKDIYLGGESYAGQYIPYFGAKLLKDYAGKYNLKGLIMINGYIYPNVQNNAIMNFAAENKLITQEDLASRSVQKALKSCSAAIKKDLDSWSSIIDTMEKTGEYINPDPSKDGNTNKVEDPECSNILEALLDMTKDTSGPEDQQCLNQYDFKLRDSYPSCGMNWPVEEVQLKAFLNDNNVASDLNLGSDHQGWQECADAPYSALVNYHSYPAFWKLPYILSKIPIMLLVGENDIVCNINGMEDIVSLLPWGGSTGFSNSTEYEDFSVDGTVYGKAKFERNLWLARVHNASHMIPYDHPVASRGALDMFFGNFTKNGDTYVAPSHGAY